MTPELETADMMVVTLQVPAREAGELAVTVGRDVIRVVGPDGFRQELALPQGADPARLHAGLFHGILELRAPRTEGEGSVSVETRAVPVSDLT
jgi:HSP20 family molecular chaperone IbpA